MPANLALDLDGNLDLVGLGLLGVELGPRLVVDRALAAERLVEELLGPVRADRGEHGHDVVGDLLAERRVTLSGGHVVHVLARGVGDLHDRRDRRVELAAVEVLRALDPHAVEHAVELRTRGRERRRVERRVRVGVAGEHPYDAPGALDEAVGARDGLGVPVEVLLGRRHEEDGKAHGVGAEWLDDARRRHHVALGLGHRVAVLVLDHALAEQVGEGLVHVEHAEVAEDFGPEARVEQVEDRVLDAADVVVDGHPAVDGSTREGCGGVVRVTIAQVVPAGAREGVHRVGDAPRGTAALGAGRLVEGRVLGEGVAGAEVEVIGQQHGQLVLGDGHVAAAVAVDHRDGVAPVALAGDEPVAQAELDLLAAAAVLAEPRDDGVDALGVLAALEAGELAGLDEVALGVHGVVPVDGADANALLVLELRVERVVLLADDRHDVEVVLLGELEVALVAAGHAHDRAGAVVHEHVVGDPDRRGTAGDRVDDVAAREDAVLLAGGTLSVDGRDLLRGGLELLEVVLVLGAGDELRGERALGREQEERHAEDRVGTGREDGDLSVGGGHAVGVGEREGDLGALGAADPVALLRLDVLGPAGERVEVVEKLLRVVGDLEVPLGELALLGDGPAAPAATLHDLLVGKDGLAGRAPVDGGRVTVREALLPHLDEHPLAPAVVVGVAGVEHAVVVVREAHALHRRNCLRDVLVRPDARLGVVLDGGVLGRQPEGVEAHGVQHVVAPHARLAGHRVADRVVARVPHVKVARGIREHLEDVLLGLGGVLVGLVELLGLPPGLPLGLDGLGVVRRDAVANLGIGLLCHVMPFLHGTATEPL